MPDLWGKISNPVLSTSSERLEKENNPVSDQSKTILTPCSVRVERCKLSSSTLVWDVEKVLMEDQTVQLLYHGVKVREGASDEEVGIMEDKNIEVQENIFKLGGYLCPKCGQAFKNRPLMKKHLLSHYYQIFFSALPNSKPFTCPICGKLNRDRIVLARHYAFFHKKIFEMTELTPEDLSLQGNGKGRCSDKCLNGMYLINSAKKRFNIKKRCSRVHEEHSYPELFKENTLNEDEEVLDDGLAVKAEKNTFYKCPKCGQSFKDTVSNVRRHILSHYQQVFFDVLPDRIPFNCPICDMCFKWRGSLVRHYAFSHQKIFELTDLTPEDLLYSKSHMKKLEQKHCESDEKRMTVLFSPLLNESEEARAEGTYS